MVEHSHRTADHDHIVSAAVVIADIEADDCKNPCSRGRTYRDVLVRSKDDCGGKVCWMKMRAMFFDRFY